MASSDSSIPHFSEFRRLPYIVDYVAGFLRRVEVSFVPLSAFCTFHPHYPESHPWLHVVSNPPRTLAFVPFLQTRRDHPTPCSPSILAWLTVTRLVQVHFRYGLYIRARPRSGFGTTFIRCCFRVSVAIHTYTIATQPTNRLLWQDSHLQDTEQLIEPLKKGSHHPRFIGRLSPSIAFIGAVYF